MLLIGFANVKHGMPMQAFISELDNNLCCGSVTLPIVCLLWPFMGVLIPSPISVVELKNHMYFLSFLKEYERRKSQ